LMTDPSTTRPLFSDHTPPPAPALLPVIGQPTTREGSASTRQTPPPWLWSAWLPLTVLLLSVRAPGPWRIPPPLPFSDVLPVTVQRSISVGPWANRPPPEQTVVL